MRGYLREMRETEEGNGRRDEGSPLESAINFLRRSTETTGEESYEARYDAATIQLKALVEWAGSRGLIGQTGRWDDVLVPGGAEHDVFFQGAECWKLTRPNHFGWTVLPGVDGTPQASKATPLEYLQRWQNANTYLGDSAHLVGIERCDYGVRAIIRQPLIVGSYPDSTLVSNYFRNKGFREVKGFWLGAEEGSSFYDAEERLGVFDASTDNFILSGGIPIPIDVVIVEVSEVLHKQLLRLSVEDILKFDQEFKST